MSSLDQLSLRKTRRYISPNPERILDAPGLVDDFYLNLLDWNHLTNILAVRDKSVQCNAGVSTFIGGA